MNFQELGLSRETLEAVNTLGYEEPSPVQAQSIPYLLAADDVIAQAQTGTGKTAAFAIPIVERIDVRRREVQALVVVPTRELATQVAEAIHALGRPRGVSVLPIYGGQPYDRQLRALRSGVHVVAGTPGRIMDHIRRETLQLGTVRMVVLDEADEMLEMGFVEDIEFILDQVPEERQMALFSATIPPRIDALARRYMREPQQVTVAHETRTAPQTRQFFHQAPQRAKLDAVTRILDFESPSSAIIFCRTKRAVDDLAETLQARGYAVAAIHGDIAQAQRERMLRDFRENRVELLIATDVAARGLDIPDVSHVINYDIPDDSDAYIHRIGRTGRMGRKGEAITLVTPREIRLLRTIEKQVGRKLKALKLPTQADIQSRRRQAFIDSLHETLESGAGEAFALLVEELVEERDPIEVAAAALHLAFTARTDGKPTTVEADGASTEPGMTRLFLDAGRRQGVRPRELVEAFSREAQIAPSAVGTIDLFDDYSLVDVRSGPAKKVLERAAVLPWQNGEIHVSRAKAPRS